MHRRLHEVPSTGGPSSMASSYRDPELERLGKQILTATCWTGVAMVEFKKNESDGRYYLLEVNPKFWGSLDLSIAAGVDFPRLLLELLVNGRRPCTTLDYRDDCVFRWLALDLAHAVETRNISAYLKAFADRPHTRRFRPFGSVAVPPCLSERHPALCAKNQVRIRSRMLRATSSASWARSARGLRFTSFSIRSFGKSSAARR